MREDNKKPADLAPVSILWEGLLHARSIEKAPAEIETNETACRTTGEAAMTKISIIFLNSNLFPELSPIVFKSRVTDTGSVRAQSVMGMEIRNKELH